MFEIRSIIPIPAYSFQILESRWVLDKPLNTLHRIQPAHEITDKEADIYPYRSLVTACTMSKSRHPVSQVYLDTVRSALGHSRPYRMRIRLLHYMYQQRGLSLNENKVNKMVVSGMC